MKIKIIITVALLLILSLTSIIGLTFYMFGYRFVDTTSELKKDNYISSDEFKLDGYKLVYSGDGLSFLGAMIGINKKEYSQTWFKDLLWDENGNLLVAIGTDRNNSMDFVLSLIDGNLKSYTVDHEITGLSLSPDRTTLALVSIDHSNEKQGDSLELVTSKGYVSELILIDLNSGKVGKFQIDLLESNFDPAWLSSTSLALSLTKGEICKYDIEKNKIVAPIISGKCPVFIANKLYYKRYEDNKQVIFSLDINDGLEKRICDSRYIDGLINVSNDGRYIALQSNYEANHKGLNDSLVNGISLFLYDCQNNLFTYINSSDNEITFCSRYCWVNTDAEVPLAVEW